MAAVISSIFGLVIAIFEYEVHLYENGFRGDINLLHDNSGNTEKAI